MRAAFFRIGGAFLTLDESNAILVLILVNLNGGLYRNEDIIAFRGQNEVEQPDRDSGLH